MSDEAKTKQLTPKQQRFVMEYLIDFNGTQAAIRAGYSKKTAGECAYEYLKKPQIKQAVEKELSDRADRLRAEADRAVLEMGALAYSNMGDYANWGIVEDEDDPGTVFLRAQLKDSDELTRDQLAAVAEVQVTKDGELKIKMHNKLMALKEVLEMTGRKTPEAQQMPPVQIVFKGEDRVVVDEDDED